MKSVILASLIFISSFCGLYSEGSIRGILKEHTKEFEKNDALIQKYAPGQAGFALALQMADSHYQEGRYTLSRAIYKYYDEYFPENYRYFQQAVNSLSNLMILHGPTKEEIELYELFIAELYNPNDKYAAIQRLAQPYINSREWDKAAEIFKKYAKRNSHFELEFEKIIGILNAPEEGIKPKNIGPSVNTLSNEWDPSPTPDGKYLYFSSRGRRDSYGAADIYYSEKTGGKWGSPKNIGRSINSAPSETVDNVSADGSMLILSGEFDGSFGGFDLYFARKGGQGWGSLEHLPAPVNTPFLDEGGCLTADGKALIFNSDRPSGLFEYKPYGSYLRGGNNGNQDIYVTLKTDSGWSKPINLGAVINTPYAERSAFLHPDGRTLYFSSNGHPGLGRMDLFKSVRLSEDSWEKWSVPVNLGKEINSAQDDWGYTVMPGGDIAYFAAYDKEGGYGGWDIFEIEMPKAAKPGKVVKIFGNITDTKGSPISADVSWEDLSSGALAGSVKSSPKDGSYMIMLPEGRHYGYFASKGGYYPVSSNIDLKKYAGNREIKHDIILPSAVELKEQKVRLSLNNIFFEYGSHELMPESKPELDRLIEFLQKNPGGALEIEGHTDSIGDADYNRRLSYKRAESVRDYILKHEPGLQAELIVSGKGEEEPAADNSLKEGRAMNRRVIIWFVREE